MRCCGNLRAQDNSQELALRIPTDIEAARTQSIESAGEQNLLHSIVHIGSLL